MFLVTHRLIDMIITYYGATWSFVWNGVLVGRQIHGRHKSGYIIRRNHNGQPGTDEIEPSALGGLSYLSYLYEFVYIARVTRLPLRVFPSILSVFLYVFPQHTSTVRGAPCIPGTQTPQQGWRASNPLLLPPVASPGRPHRVYSVKTAGRVRCDYCVRAFLRYYIVELQHTYL